MAAFLTKFFDCLTFFLLNPIEIDKFYDVEFAKFFSIQIFMLNLVYCFFSLLFAFYTFTVYNFSFNVGMNLQVFQLIFPTIIQIHLTINFIESINIKMRTELSKSMNETQKTSGKIKIAMFLAILITVRAIKTVIGGRLVDKAYAMSLLMPELVASLSDFVFALHVDNLTTKIKEFNEALRFKPMNLRTVNEVQEALTNFHKTSQTICRIHSNRLFLTLTFNFINFVVSFYWIFIRIAFNHLGNCSTFLYIIQPSLSYFAIFNSAQKCCLEVRRNSRDENTQKSV
jgi:hypothetical protein